MIFKRKGSFATPMTPFNPDKTIDYDSLQREVDFIIKSNAAAIVSPVMVSEFQILSEDERINHVKVTLDVAKGRIRGGCIGFCAQYPSGTKIFKRGAEVWSRLRDIHAAVCDRLCMAGH